MEIQHFSHNCPLMLHNQLNSAELCALCNQPIPTIRGPPVYGCSKCNFVIHISCAQLPQEINHPFHPQHPLTLFDSPPTRSGKSSCDACGFYSPHYCFYCFWCDFRIDLNCASLTPIEDHECHHKNHTNLGHPHPFIPCITNKNIFDFHCSGCMRPIDGPIFVCLQCHFVLHESCAKSPHKIRHPFHPQHSLTLVERFHHSESCNACQSIFNGFIYRCGECKFKLDTKCALLIPNVKFKLHQHPLVFLTAYRCDCVKCGCKDCKQVFRCVDCDFNLHLHCAPTLPLKAKHQCHRHYLTLTKSPVKDLPDENDDSELYCDVCEQLRYLPDPTYYCTECHFVAHIHCMISEEEALALGEESFVVGQLTGDADDAANHGKTVGEDLNKEGMVVNEEEAESSVSILIWACSSLALVAHGQRVGTLFDWIFEFISSVDLVTGELFWVMCWCIWTHRNQVVFNDTAQTEVELARYASEYYQEVCAVQTRVRVSQQVLLPIRWTPPVEGLVKANFDGACSVADGFIGVGIVVQDHTGAVIAAMSAKQVSAMEVDCIEAFAALAAIQFALDLGLHHIVLEGDSLMIVRAFHSVSKSLASFGHFVEQAKSLLPRFHSWAVQHVKREGNSVAHCLARMAFALDDFSMWLEEVPLSLRSLVRREASL